MPPGSVAGSLEGAMSERVTQEEFVARIHRSRAAWDGLIQGISREEMQKPGFCGDWSLKDVIAHITWYERAMVRLLQARAFVGSSLWELPLHERNAAIFRENKDTNLGQVLDESQQAFVELMSELDALTDDDLNDPARFPGMPPDWQPWQVIASNTCEHYEDHASQAEARLAAHASRD